MLDLLDEAAVSYQIVLTKADEVKPDALATTVAEIAAARAQAPRRLSRTCSPTSARTGAGIPELRAAIARLLAEE